MLHGGTKGRNASDEICVRIVTLSRSGRPRGAQPVLTARLPAAVAIFDVIAGYDLADPVTAASQGKRADSYLRFLDKDGARLGVVHQLFTSEDADPGAMTRIGPQRERFSPPRASGRCRFGEGTFASTHGNGQDAPTIGIGGTSRCRPSHTTGHTGHVPGGSTGVSWDTDIESGPEPGFGVLASPRLVRSFGSRRPEFHPGAPVPRPVNTGSSAAFHS